MDHVAIMKKKWKLIDLILSGEKTIESRWYVARGPPFGRITAGDIIYFRDSGDPVTARAEVETVLQFSDLTPEKTDRILREYGKRIGFSYRPDLHLRYAGKRYCILMFLKDAKAIDPFRVDKTGYGVASAWMCVGDIERVKVKPARIRYLFKRAKTTSNR